MMDWQLLAVAIAVTGAGFYLARGWWRSWRNSKSGCGGNCSCPGDQRRQALIASDQLTARIRRQDDHF